MEAGEATRTQEGTQLATQYTQFMSETQETTLLQATRASGPVRRRGLGRLSIYKILLEAALGTQDIRQSLQNTRKQYSTPVPSL